MYGMGMANSGPTYAVVRICDPVFIWMATVYDVIMTARWLHETSNTCRSEASKLIAILGLYYIN